MTLSAELSYAISTVGIVTWSSDLAGIESAEIDRGSLAVEVKLDLEAMTATRVWDYGADPVIGNPIMGDVQRLLNGNTIVSYSVAGVLHEVDAQAQVLHEMAWPLGSAFGYTVLRTSLYGPPPK